MKKRAVQQRISRVLILSLAILLLGGGIAVFCQWHQGPIPGHASSDSVVGQPSLPAATVDSIFRRVGSPMAGTGQAVETAARAAHIDDAFALAVWWTETNDGEAGVGRADRNPGSVRGSVGYPSAYDGFTIYPSYTAAVNYWFPLLQRAYISRGLTTVSSIAHRYVGTSTSYLWAGKVTALMNRYRGEAPPPTATPGRAQTSAVHAQGVQQSQAQQQHDQATEASLPQQQAAPVPLGTLSLFLLFILTAILALGAWARVNRKRSVSASLLHPSVPSTETLWADLRASHQQPSVFFGQRSLGGLPPITDDFSLHTPRTGTLGMTAPIDLEYTSRASLASLLAHTPSATLPSTGQLFFDTLSYEEPVEQLPFDAPVLPSTGQFPASGTPAQYPLQAAHPLFYPPAFASPSNGLHRIQPTGPAQAPRPQLVGAQHTSERSGGLLSRYRETQAR